MRFPPLKIDGDAIAREAGSPRYCPHLKQELRKKIDKSGQPRLWKQCLNCGAPVGTRVGAKPYNWHQMAAMPLFDEELRKSYFRAYIARYEAQRLAETERLRAQVRDEYQQYLRTPEWIAKRNLVLQREQRLCQGCRAAPATEAHHTTYVHIGEEFLFELVAVCRPCHDRFHESEFPRFLDSLYLAIYPAAEATEEV
jgi:5-methylcytosine-specific restriction endonuclease McrA